MRRYRFVRWGLYLLNFFFLLQWALAMFYNAPFLVARGIPESYLGFVFAGSAAVGGLFLLLAPALARRHGLLRTFIRFALLVAAASAGLAFVEPALLVVPVFILATSSFYLLAYSLDLFLETATPSERSTGGVRALFLTAANAAIAAAPYLGSRILGDEQYVYLYLTTALLSIPILFVAFMTLRRMSTIRLPRVHWWSTVRSLLRRRDMRRIFWIQFLLRLFFAAMVVYTPVYLHEQLGFSLGELGLVFSIMLLPYLLIEIPLGNLADTRWGEKEALVIGFLIMAGATAALSFLDSPSLFVWGAVLFMTRVGAAFIDIMSESYFFKHVNGGDPGFVSAFRILYPIAYIIGPVFASLFLFSFPLQYLFVTLAGITLLGIPAAARLRDTR